MCACASVGEGDGKRKAECACVCIAVCVCMFEICICESERIIDSEHSAACACVSEYDAYAPWSTHTHTQHVLVFVCLFAGRGQHTSETQGDMQDHHTLQRHCWLQKMEERW